MAELDHSRAMAASKRLIEYHRQADESGEWTFFVDEMYATDCVHICEYAGSMLVEAHGIDEIKATHYGEDMQHGWEGWTFPYTGAYLSDDGRVITQWMNRGPGERPDGSYYETPGFSMLTFNSDYKICHQKDVFDIAHQMWLCDELEAVGLLSEDLKRNWVLPTKRRLIDMLSRRLD